MSLERHSNAIVITNMVFRFEDARNSFMPKSGYRMESDSPAPPPMIPPVQTDDEWRYTAPLQTAGASSQSNVSPTPPPPVVRSTWQDLFMDPFRPSPPTFNYMEQRRNQEAEARISQEERKHEEQRKAQEVPELEQRRPQETEQQRREEKLPVKQPRESFPAMPPSLEEIQSKNLDMDVPELEEEDIPDLEDVDDGPPPKVNILLALCKRPSKCLGYCFRHFQHLKPIWRIMLSLVAYWRDHVGYSRRTLLRLNCVITQLMIFSYAIIQTLVGHVQHC